MTRTFEYLHQMRDFAQWRRGDAILLGEVNAAPDTVNQYFGKGTEAFHMLFNFYVNQYLFYGLATGDPGPLADALRATKNIPPGSQWAQFLRNHDELDLGRLSEEQRQRVFEIFGPEEEMQAYGRGIRRRLAPMLGERRRMELAYSLLFSLPGTPVIYYGDEIGMGEDLSLPERMSVRTPMQWTGEAQAGFSTADELVRPLIDEGPYSYQRVNVEDQRRDPDSLLNWMVHMIRLRKECPEIGWGDWELLQTGNAAVLAMRYDWRGNSLIVLHNFSDQPQTVEIEPDVPGGELLVNLQAGERSRADEPGRHRLALDPYGYRWYRVGGLQHILVRQRG